MRVKWYFVKDDPDRSVDSQGRKTNNHRKESELSFQLKIPEKKKMVAAKTVLEKKEKRAEWRFGEQAPGELLPNGLSVSFLEGEE